MTDTIIKATNRVFTKLRKKGFHAEKGLCCMTCSLAEIPDGVARYAFYHSQDASDAKKSGILYIAYGSDAGLDDAVVGTELANALKADGLVVDWNGNPLTRIRVKLPLTTE